MSDSVERRKPFVIAARPSKEVRRFFEENPDARWDDCLGFLLNYWPQMINRRVEYLIEGGIAVKLLHPQRQEPSDVDVLSRSAKMERAFANTQRIDVKSVAHWFARRLWPYNMRAFNAKRGEFIMGYSQEVIFRDRQVLILNSLGLAVSKTLVFNNMPQRDKDIEDLKLLERDPEEIQAVIDRIRLAYPRRDDSKQLWLP